MAAKASVILLLIGLTCLKTVCGEGIIWIQFESYESGCGDCDPMFTFCVDRPSNQISVERRDCSYGVAGESDHYHNKGTVTFGNNIKGISNPWRVRFGRLHERQIMLVMRARDDDLVGADHMVTLSTRLTEKVYPTESLANKIALTTRTITQGSHKLRFKIKIFCIENFYYWDCSRKCVPEDSVRGHYDCNIDTGEKICHEGWTGANCHVDKDECALGFCKNGECKNLKGDYYCHCEENYSGKNCSILGDPCETIPCQNNGTCDPVENQFNYTCNCSDGWTGQACELRVDPCESGPCNNSAECISNEENTNFTCICEPLFEGLFCERKIEPPTTTLAPTTRGPGGGGRTSRLSGKDSEGFLYWHGLLIGLSLLIIVILIILFLIFRRRRKEKENCPTGLPPGNTVHYAEGNLAFENNMYNNGTTRGISNGHTNGVIRQQPPLPTTPTDDDMFNPVKPPILLAENETQGAVGGYEPADEPDESGYMKPSSIEKDLKTGESPRTERAQSNPYADFRDVASNLQGGAEQAEPHYQDLDEIAMNFHGLNPDSRDDQCLVEDKLYSSHGHSPRTTVKLKAMADQTLEFDNHGYFSSSTSSVSDDSEYGQPKNESSPPAPQENQYSEPAMSASSQPGTWNLSAPLNPESQYSDIPSNTPVTPPLTLNGGENAYAPIDADEESDLALAQRISARRQTPGESPYAEPAVPASPLPTASPSDPSDFKNQPYAEMSAPAHRTPSNGFTDDYDDDDDDIPSFGLPHVDTNYASPTGTLKERPTEPLYADPREPEPVTSPGGDYVSPRSAADPPAVPPKPEPRTLRPAGYEDYDPATPSTFALPLPSSSTDEPEETFDELDDTPDFAFSHPEAAAASEVHDNPSGPPKLPALFLENHAFGRSEI